MKYSLLMAGLLFVTHLANGQQTVTPPPDADNFSGKVVETTNAATYTYVLADNGTRQVWAAAPKFTVKPGDAVTFSTAMPMKNFHSDGMNRDFAEIYFTGSIAVNGASSVAAQLPAGHPAIGSPAAVAKVEVSGIKPAPGGKTVAEIFAASAELKGQPLRVRGKVVKYNAGIMQKNWVHIQDGTGSTGSNDLLVTTTDAAKVGDTVLVNGKVAINQDFGSGYKFNVMLEEAKVTVE